MISHDSEVERGIEEDRLAVLRAIVIRARRKSAFPLERFFEINHRRNEHERPFFFIKYR